MTKHTKVINIFGGPGSGKSTISSDLFRYMKQQEISVELVGEVAKDWIHEGNYQKLWNCQDLLTAEQNYRQSRLMGKYDFIIADSPIILGMFYVPQGYYKSYAPFVSEIFQSYDNVNIMLQRRPNAYYVTEHRVHNKAEADTADLQLRSYLKDNGILHFSTVSDNNAAYSIWQYLKESIID
jgi:ABC-type cobalamin/Fe3+-siderophores transport system ATPase subunit